MVNSITNPGGFMSKTILKRIATTTILALVCIAVLIYLKYSGETKSTTQSIFAMDTYMEITAYGRNGENAVEAATAEIERLDSLLSTGSDTSEVTMLNKNAGGTLSNDTRYLLKRSLEIYDSTDGVFDITIYPIMKAWGFASGDFKVPDQDTLSNLVNKVDSSKLVYNDKTNTLTMPEGVEIDFGGIAKGYTSNQIVSIMREYGIKSAKINLGGNVQTLGAKTDGSKWRIAIRTPDDSLGVEYLGVVDISDQAVITSGGYERYFEQDGISYHHIIDTSTGYPANTGIISATIISQDATMADALSTAIYCMGLDKATAYWQSHSDDFDMILYDTQKGLYITKGIENTFTSQLPITVIPYTTNQE
jgi:thiamine biosynthesis lipoprotein